jgi:hypothetical protein
MIKMNIKNELILSHIENMQIKKPEGLAPQPTLFSDTNLVFTKLDFAKIQ